MSEARQRTRAECIIEALRADGPLRQTELRDRVNANPSQLRKLLDAGVIVNLHASGGGYHLVESLPEVAQPNRRSNRER